MAPDLKSTSLALRVALKVALLEVNWAEVAARVGGLPEEVDFTRAELVET